MSSLKDKIVVITGGNSGIGYATAKAFLAKGAKVLITGRQPGAVQKAVHALGHPAEGFKADQSDMNDIRRLYEYLQGRFGKIDALFVNAGVAKLAPFETVTEELYDELMNINFKGAYFTIQQLLPLVNDGGSITLLSALNAYAGSPNASVLSASKAALNSLGRTLSRELSDRKIRVNIVNPGIIDTPLLTKVGVPEAARPHLQNITPLGRLGQPEDIASMVTFLASDEASFITGAEYNVDGGLMVHPLIG
ncbi:glucose 1-dehydrogenase [Chitinophaga arvensicola]|uniref:NAD(P)-dependent dehydrogenase, short-chain alcohol dehydrogenase family n=1 Tax=Chitinophaga arvensicola TaxID=29529 RepID=A0A1I0SAC3_9BACT|nr:glucose 1-dehydrogenase [Chitinophaga arvensicola]SEW53253.1 NAD(P)-dependent dehydrogenase, short-chain alcohol dehydrogenase family [Chitinophaga arvensicola]